MPSEPQGTSAEASTGAVDGWSARIDGAGNNREQTGGDAVTATGNAGIDALDAAAPMPSANLPSSAVPPVHRPAPSNATMVAESRSDFLAAMDDATLFERALGAIDAGQPEQGQRLLEQLVARSPSSALANEARRRLSDIYAKRFTGDGPGNGAPNGGAPTPPSEPSVAGAAAQPGSVATAPDSAPNSPTNTATGTAPPNSSGNAAGLANAGPLLPVGAAAAAPAAPDVAPGSGPVPPASATNASTEPVAAPLETVAVPAPPAAWRDRARRSHRFEAMMSADVGDRVFFSPSSSDVGARARAVLERQARWIGRFPDLYIVVEGHADDPGDDAANQTLSLQRAERARQLLIAEGVPAERLDVDARGRLDRLADCASPQCQAQNRRVLTRLMVVLPAAKGKTGGADR